MRARARMCVREVCVRVFVPAHLVQNLVALTEEFGLGLRVRVETGRREPQRRVPVNDGTDEKLTLDVQGTDSPTPSPNLLLPIFFALL